jgi:hypothetical protein
MGFRMFLRINSDFFFSINKLIFVMETHCVLLEVGTEILNII